jgi:hypothetical protein
MKLPVYACRTFDETLQTCTRSRFKYAMAEISKFAGAEPIMDDCEDVERPSPGQWRKHQRHVQGYA